MKEFFEIKGGLKQIVDFAKKNPLTDFLDYLLKVFLIWRIRNVALRRFILVLSIVTGILAGLSAVLMKSGVHFVETLTAEKEIFSSTRLVVSLLPLVGILLTTLYFELFVKGKKRVGLKSVLFSISQKRGNIPSSGIYSSVVGSSITVGSGGSVGLEAPIVSTGAAIGSNIGKLSHLGHKSKILLIGCGVAGGIAAVFNTPLTGVIFALEVLMMDLTMASMIPLLLAAVAGNVTTMFFLGNEIILKFPQELTYNTYEIPFFILFGLLSGVASIHLTKTKTKVFKRFEKLKNPYVRALLGGLALCILIFFFPSLKGEGYQSIKESFNLNSFNWVLPSISSGIDFYHPFVLLFSLVLLYFLKTFASTITIAAGGEGGIIAPALGLGSILGLLFYQVLSISFPNLEVTYTAYILLGMAGMIAGAFHAPLTSIFLIAEATESYELLVPLIIVSSFSFLMVRYFERHSIYASELAKKNQLLSRNKDLAMMSMLSQKNIISHNLPTTDFDKGFEGLFEVMKNSKRNIYPVIDQGENFYGVIYFDELKDLLLDKENISKQTFTSFIQNPPEIINKKDSMLKIVNKFEKTEAWYLPILADGKYQGMASRSIFFEKYRKLMQKYSDD